MKRAQTCSFQEAPLAKFSPLWRNSLDPSLRGTHFGYLCICSLTTLSFGFVFRAASLNSLSSALVAGLVFCCFAYERRHVNAGKTASRPQISKSAEGVWCLCAQTATNHRNRRQISESWNSPRVTPTQIKKTLAQGEGPLIQHSLSMTATSKLLK